jgi:hypothetical protein
MHFMLFANYSSLCPRVGQSIMNKKAGTRRFRLSSWCVCPDKNCCSKRGVDVLYALRRGRTVKSRTCAKMLDICIPFSCER